MKAFAFMYNNILSNVQFLFNFFNLLHFFPVKNHMSCTLVIIPDGSPHTYMAYIIVIKPWTKTEFKRMKTSGYSTKRGCYENVFTSGIFSLFVNVNLYQEKHKEQTIKGMNLYYYEI